MIRRLLPILTLAAAFIAAAFPAGADPVYQSSTIACTRSAQVSPSTATSTLLVASAGTLNNGTKPQIYVCGVVASAAAAQSVQLVHGATGGTCPTPVSITPVLNIGATLPLVDHPAYYSGLPVVPNTDDLCVVTTQATGTGVIVYYAQF